MKKLYYQDKIDTFIYYFKIFLEGLREPKRIINRGWIYFLSRNAGVFIISYPKTGRTWLRIMLGNSLILKYKLNNKMILDTLYLTKKAGLVTTVFSHGGPFLLRNSAPYYNMNFNEKFYKKKKVILLIRDIRDTLVSSYFEESKRLKIYKGSLSDFIRDKRFGVKKIVTFYNIWFINKNIPKKFLLVRYEDMHKRPIEILREVLNFINLKEIEEDILNAAVSFASFNQMKKMEEQNIFGDSILRPGEKSDNESYKVRRGKIGGYVDYFTKEDLVYIDQVVMEMGLRDCDWYYYISEE